jgi:8-oxo-dGTP pyrophosphatase MutT (NUDIX family)
MSEAISRSPIEQVSAIPYRRTEEGIELCLITSIKKGRWGFPKGIIDPGETYIQSALKEAYEEAGLHGHILEEPVGWYEYAKWGTTLTVTVVLMEVSQCDDHWMESEMRQRQWASPEAARQLIDRTDVKGLLDVALSRLKEAGSGHN